MAYFTGRDRELIEALVYNPEAKPAFEMLKACLAWEDERPHGLTPAGYARLCDLWIARSFLQQGKPFSSDPLDPEYFGRIWEEALRDGIRWPGFRRLTLSAEDREYYETCLRELAEGEF